MTPLKLVVIIFQMHVTCLIVSVHSRHELRVVLLHQIVCRHVQHILLYIKLVPETFLLLFLAKAFEVSTAKAETILETSLSIGRTCMLTLEVDLLSDV